tara:strand:+ start:87 stop:587 length:501 start_codon:yes stop_codon:yes gene_type:complete
MKDENEAVAPAAENKSIIGEKYRGKYTGAGDWLAGMVDGQVQTPEFKDKTVKDEDGNETTTSVATGQKPVDLTKLFALAAANGIDAETRYGDQIERPNATGRLRMTIGNMLRARARKRHGLNDIEGNFVKADADFVGEHPKTQHPDGSKIAVEQPEVEADEEAEDA